MENDYVDQFHDKLCKIMSEFGSVQDGGRPLYNLCAWQGVPSTVNPTVVPLDLGPRQILSSLENGHFYPRSRFSCSA